MPDQTAAPRTRSLKLDSELAADVERITGDRRIAEADVIRDLIRRGVRDYDHEQELLRTLGRRAG